MLEKIIMFPFILLLLIIACIGIPMEFVLTFWMDEPVDFWRSLARDLKREI